MNLTAPGAGTPVITVSASVASDLAGLVASLASQINATAGYKAAAAGTVLTISTEGANAGKTFSLTSASPSGSIVEQAVTSTRELVLFAPSSEVPIDIGDKWTVTLTVAGTATQVTVPVLADLDKLVADLTAAIGGLPGFKAQRSGAVITVSTEDANAGKTFSTTYGVARIFADQSAAAAAGSTVGLARGAPLVNQVWQVKVGGVDHDHTVVADETLADVVAALAKHVNDTSAFVAASRGDTIVVLGAASFGIPTRINGAGAATAIDGGTVVIAGTGTPRETVTVDLGTSRHGITVRESVPLAEIAAGLAARINAAGSGFIASVDGDTLVITDTNI
ncbi:MAG: hypothetical protein IPK39_05810 [Sulfuritalea sp.]|nr:hypothetical protein [Sulfuritalea sp.]